jgi:hypothetical protein
MDFRSRRIQANVCRPFNYDHLVVSQECFIGPGALVRRSALRQVGGWREDLSRTPDREFWMRLGTLGHVEFVPKSLAGYRLHPESISFRENEPERAMEYVNVVNLYFDSNIVPERLRGRRAEALGFAYLMVSRSCIRGGFWREGYKHFRTAFAHNPAIANPKQLYRQLRTVVGRPLRRIYWRLQRLFS